MSEGYKCRKDISVQKDTSAWKDMLAELLSKLDRLYFLFFYPILTKLSLKPPCSHEVFKNIVSFKLRTWEGGFYSEHTISVTNKQTNTAFYNIDM